MNRKIVASIELGLTTIKILVTEFVGHSQTLLDQKRLYVKNITSFMFQDPQKLADKIQSLINKINQNLGFDINKYVVIIPQNELVIKEINAKIENLSPNYVITKKIQKQIGLEFQKNIDQSKHIIHYVGRKYVIDGNRHDKLPIGLQGRHISQNALAYAVPKTYFDLVEGFLSFIKISVVGFYPKGLAYTVELIDETSEPSDFDVVVDVNDYWTDINIYNKGYLMEVINLEPGYMTSVIQICEIYGVDLQTAIGYIDSHVDFSIFKIDNARENKSPSKLNHQAKTNEVFWKNTNALSVKLYNFISSNTNRIKSLYFVGPTNEVKGFDEYINSHFKNLPFHVYVSGSDLIGVNNSDMLSNISANRLAYMYEDEGIFFNETEHTTNEIIVVNNVQKVKTISRRQERKQAKQKLKIAKKAAKENSNGRKQIVEAENQTNQIDWLLKDN